MSSKNYKTTRLSKEEARKLIAKVAPTGRVIFTSHALEKINERGIIINDVMNVLLSSAMRVSDAEPKGSGFTYRCSTTRFVVAIGFTVQGDGVIVVTVFRADRKR